MNSQPRGDLVPGGLAMVYGLKNNAEFNGVVCELYRFCVEGVAYQHPVMPERRILLEAGDGDGWAVTSPSLHAGDPSEATDLGWAFFDERNLLPINPSADPLEITQQQECEV